MLLCDVLSPQLDPHKALKHIQEKNRLNEWTNEQQMTPFISNHIHSNQWSIVALSWLPETAAVVV